MQQIADWLEKLGMSEYAQKFAENDIDAGVLPELTDQDLRILSLLKTSSDPERWRITPARRRFLPNGWLLP